MRKRRLFEIVTIGYLCNCVSIMGACLYAHASGFRNVYMFMLFQTDTAVFLLVTAYLTVRLFLPAFRRFLYSSYVWRLRQTSSAFSSFLSNGCFSLPAPTYGCSMSGTQVSPSFLPTVFFFLFYLCQQTVIITSKTWCTRKSQLPSSFNLLTFYFPHVSYLQRGESVYPRYRCGSCLCTLKLPYGSKIWRTFMLTCVDPLLLTGNQHCRAS